MTQWKRATGVLALAAIASVTGCGTTVRQLGGGAPEELGTTTRNIWTPATSSAVGQPSGSFVPVPTGPSTTQAGLGLPHDLPRPTAQPTPGASHLRPLRIGWVLTGGNPTASVGAVLGPPDVEAVQRRWLAALRDELNQQGGVAGRRVDFSYVAVDQTNQSAGTQTQLQNEACSALTEDAHVDVVAYAMTFQTVMSNECYARHRTPLLTNTPGTAETFEGLSPWLLPSPDLNLSRAARLIPMALREQGFLNDKIGVITYDMPDFRSTTDKLLIPGLEAAGGKVVERVYLATTYDGVAQGNASAILRFRQAGVDRVVLFAPGGGEWVLFTDAAEAQRYRPRYAISTMDGPRPISTQIQPGQLQGTVGVGWRQDVDIDPRYMKPPRPAERRCWDILNRRAGESLRTHDQNTGSASEVCEKVFYLRAALNAFAGRELVRDQLLGAFRSLGGSYEPVQYETFFVGPRAVDGIRSYRSFAFEAGDSGCGCFRYTSATHDIPAL